MPTKPDDLPVWATDDSYPAGAQPWAESDTKIEPLSGKQAEGFEPREKPGAQTLNWLFNLIYKWLAWANAIPETIIVPLIPNIRYDEFPDSLTGQINGNASGMFEVEISDTYPTWQITLSLPIGSEIQGVRAWWDTGAATFLKVTLARKEILGIGYDVIATVIADGVGGVEMDEATGLSHEVESGWQYIMLFTRDSGTDQMFIYNSEIDILRYAHV